MFDAEAAMEEELDNLANSEIVQAFRGSCVLVTGGTGLMGQVLVEKLLRSCELKKIFLLTRPKKGKNEKERFDQIFSGLLFNRLKMEQSNWKNKVHLISGDINKRGLGLSSEDGTMLIQEVEIIFHGAATVRFDAAIWDAVSINILGTKDLVELASKMPKLKAFVHISTAYSNCPRKEIKEKFYRPPLRWNEVTELVNTLDKETLHMLTPILLDKWPNTYSFTKALAEDMLQDTATHLPIGIIRPSIIVNSVNEPVVAWINNLYGAVGVVAAAGGGIIKSMHCHEEILADIVPVDLSINATIAVAWEIMEKDEKSMELIQIEDKNVSEEEIPIYNYVSSNQNPITWADFMKYNEYSINYPSYYCIWYYCFCLNRHYFIHKIYVFFLHFIPSLIMDFGAKLFRKQQIMVKAYQKIEKFTNVITYFSTQQWLFHSKNTERLWEKLNPRDKHLFNFDISSVDWEVFLFSMIKGMRVYIAGDNFDTLPETRARYKKLMYLHYGVIYIFRFLFIFYMYKLFFHVWIAYKDRLFGTM